MANRSGSAGEFYDWKHSVCPSCEHTSVCDKGVVELGSCLDEEEELYPSGGIRRLLRRALRHITRNGSISSTELATTQPTLGLHVLRPSVSRDRWPKPQERKAELICSDLTEFDRICAP